MNVGRLEELRTRIKTLAISITLNVSAFRSGGFGGFGYDNHSGCSQVAERIQQDFSNDLLIVVRQKQNQKYHGGSYIQPLHPPATQQSATRPLLKKLQELAESCKKCKENVETSQLNTFCLSLAGNDLRQVAMLPE